MNNPWREMGFIGRRKPKQHKKVVLVKKRLGKCIKKFNTNRQKLIQLHLRNRIKYLVIEELERKLEDVRGRKNDRKRLQIKKSPKDIQ